GTLNCYPPGDQNECTFNYDECSNLPGRSKFNGRTTDFSLEDDITRVRDAILEIINSGIIDFKDQELNFEKLDLNTYVVISQNLISIDTTQEGISRLNAPAFITFYNVNFQNPKILRDGVDCIGCQIIGYTNGNFMVLVPGLSKYEVTESGSGGASPGGDSGGGGGGGSSFTEVEEDISERSCREQWICDPWSVCEDGTQLRGCYDINNCGTTQLKPIIQRECEEETLIEKIIEFPTVVKETRNITIYMILIITIIALVVLEEALRFRKKQKLKERHKHIFELIHLIEKNAGKYGIAKKYYDLLIKEFEIGDFTADEEKFIRREILQLYNKITRKHKIKTK
ncbi:MAG: hypothetical protein AABY07_09915, partial [Nanoarchaeota archaeon]